MSDIDPGSDSVLVLGGGIAGLQAAIDLADLGFQVHVIERTPSIGGRMAQLDKTFPTNDCSLCILAPKMIECASHPRIRLHTLSELVQFEGAVGGFRATIRRASRYVDEDKCTGCGDCAPVCPIQLPNEFELGLTQRATVYRPYPQAVPNVFAITKSGRAPCRDACPAGVNAHGYVQLVRAGLFDAALEVIHRTLPLAGTIGRICPRPCENACTRAEIDEPVGICALKRTAADLGVHAPVIEADSEMRAIRQTKPVAIVGSGPGGLTAAYSLARRGYPVTVFEKLPVAGGMLRVGVPAYRLPREILEQEIELIRALGVEIRTSAPIAGIDGVHQLFDEGFAAVFIATGAHASIGLKIPGEELEGVMGAVDLLRSVALDEPVVAGRHAVVIGGGNAAIDAARTLLRLGSDQVTLLYRRTRTEMPALAWEVEAALVEGVRLMTLAAPVRIEGANGKVKALRATRMQLGDPDASGRPRPVPLSDSEFAIPCDTIVSAVGQAPEAVLQGGGIESSKWGTIAVDPHTCATGMPGVFAGGDAVSGPATAIEAVAAGNRAADAIHAYLCEASVDATPLTPTKESAGLSATRLTDKELAQIAQRERATIHELPPDTRIQTFAEVEHGLRLKDAVTEAERCLNCATCCECRECERACQAGAVDHSHSDELISLGIGACVMATGFDMLEVNELEEYGKGRIANVVTGLEFERLLSASGPTGGHLERPSDGRAPVRLAFIQCVGSRDRRNRVYCSAVCCMHATKEAVLAHEHDAAVRSTIFYMDLRAAGKAFQEYVARAREDYAVSYVRARPARLEEVPETGDVRVIYEDTISRKRRDEVFDLVVLCQALIPSPGVRELAALLGVEVDEHGFIRIPDPLGAPVDTTVPGVLVAGYASGPQDIPDSVIQASAAAGRVAELLARRARHG